MADIFVLIYRKWSVNTLDEDMIDDIKSDLETRIEGCRRCQKEWFETYEDIFDREPTQGVDTISNLIDYDDYGIEKSGNYSGLMDIVICCPVCKQTLSFEENVVTDITEFREAIGSEIASDMSENLVGRCEFCDEGQIRYAQMEGEANTLEDLMRDDYFFIPFLDKIEDEVVCSNCGRPVWGGVNVLSVSDANYMYDEEWEYYEDDREFLIQSIDISPFEAQEFLFFLQQHPMMALTHEVGKKIFDKLTSETMPGLSSLMKGLKLYRGRARNTVDRHVPYVMTEMWAPPFERAPNGRFNPIGARVLYLADHPKTVVEEVNHDFDNISNIILEIGVFEIMEHMKVLDIRGTDYESILSTPSLNVGMVKMEYLLSNFIAQCCSVVGVEAILYGSTKRTNGWNLAVLSYKEGENINLESLYVCESEHNIRAIELGLKPDDPTLHF